MAWQHLYRGQRECPHCGSQEIARSRRHGALESLLKATLRLRPYRCQECGERFFGYAGAARAESPPGDKEAA